MIDWTGVGCELHRMRRALKMSQAELAEYAGVSRNYISLIERGMAPGMSVEIFLRLCLWFGCAPAALIPDWGGPPPTIEKSPRLSELLAAAANAGCRIDIRLSPIDGIDVAAMEVEE